MTYHEEPYDLYCPCPTCSAYAEWYQYEQWKQESAQEQWDQERALRDESNGEWF